MNIARVAVLVSLLVIQCRGEAVIEGQLKELLAAEGPEFEFTSTCDYDINIVAPVYVSNNGNDGDPANGWGASAEKPFKTIQNAVNNRVPCQTIFVMSGYTS